MGCVYWYTFLHTVVSIEQRFSWAGNTAAAAAVAAAVAAAQTSGEDLVVNWVVNACVDLIVLADEEGDAC